MNKFKVVTNIMLDMKIEFDDGFELTRAAVLMVIDKPLITATKHIYPELAKRYDSSIPAVERCIRTTAEKTAKKNNLDRMTNLHFVRYMANKARMILSEEEDKINV